MIPYANPLTPNALKRLRRGCGSCLLRNTSDLGLGGFLGRIITRVSSLMSSSNNLLSDETDNCLWTRSWWSVPSVLRQSGKRQRSRKRTYKIKVVHNATAGIYGEFAIAIPGKQTRWYLKMVKSYGVVDALLMWFTYLELFYLLLRCC